MFIARLLVASLVMIALTRSAHAQSASPSLVIVGDATQTQMVNVRRLDANAPGPWACVLPCTLALPAGRYDVISLDADLHATHRAIDVHAPNTRVDVDTRARTDAMWFGAGVGIFAFGGIVLGTGLILWLGGMTAQSTADQSAASLMSQCQARFTDPTAIAACCLNVSGSATTGQVTTGSSTARSECVPQSFAPSIVSGIVAAGLGVVGAVVGTVIMVSSARVARHDELRASRRAQPISLGFDTTVVPGGAGIAATLRF